MSTDTTLKRSEPISGNSGSDIQAVIWEKLRGSCYGPEIFAGIDPEKVKSVLDKIHESYEKWWLDSVKKLDYETANMVLNVERHLRADTFTEIATKEPEVGKLAEKLASFGEIVIGQKLRGIYGYGPDVFANANPVTVEAVLQKVLDLFCGCIEPIPGAIKTENVDLACSMVLSVVRHHEEGSLTYVGERHLLEEKTEQQKRIDRLVRQIIEYKQDANRIRFAADYELSFQEIKVVHRLIRFLRRKNSLSWLLRNRHKTPKISSVFALLLYNMNMGEKLTKRITTAFNGIVEELQSYPETPQPTKQEQILDVFLAQGFFATLADLSPIFEETANPERQAQKKLNEMNKKLEPYGFTFERVSAYKISQLDQNEAT